MHVLVNVNAQPSLMQRNNSKLTRRRISRRFLSIDCNSLKSGRVSASTLTSFGVSTKSSALSAPPLGTSQFEGVAIVDGVYCSKLEGKWQGCVTAEDCAWYHQCVQDVLVIGFGEHARCSNAAILPNQPRSPKRHNKQLAINVQPNAFRSYLSHELSLSEPSCKQELRFWKARQLQIKIDTITK